MASSTIRHSLSSERERNHAAVPTDQPIDRPPRKVTVYVGIVSAVVLLLAVMALFLFRSMAGREPAHVAVVRANEKWLGAELTIAGPSLPLPYEAKIERSDRFSVPFFLPAGAYELHVRVGGAEVYGKRFELRGERELQIDLPAEVPTTRPTTRAAAE
jgi:hypothetical protein